MYDLTISLFQVWAGAISNGPSNYPLNASYKTADAYSFQVPVIFSHWVKLFLLLNVFILYCDALFLCIVNAMLYFSLKDALGKSLEEICTIVPGGSLVFFPSYKLMEKLCMRWRETGQWSRLCLKKDLFVGE